MKGTPREIAGVVVVFCLCVLLENARADDKWPERKSLAFPRRGLSAESAGGEFIMFAGGYGAEGASDFVDVFWIYDTSLVMNETLSVARGSMGSISLAYCAFFAGGYDGSAASATLDAFCPNVSSWDENTHEFIRLTGDLSLARFSLGAAGMGRLAFFAGGMADGGLSGRVDILDIYSIEFFVAELDRPRWGAGGSAIDSNGGWLYFVFAGGDDGTDVELVDFFSVYVNESGSFGDSGTVLHLTEGRSFPGVVSIAKGESDPQNEIFIAGGYSHTKGAVRTIDAFHVDTQELKSDSHKLVEGRYSFAAIALNGSSSTVGGIVFFAGGSSGGGPSTFDDVISFKKGQFFGSDIVPLDSIETFDISTGVWGEETLSQARYDLAGASAGGFILIGGGMTESDFSDRVDIFDWLHRPSLSVSSEESSHLATIVSLSVVGGLALILMIVCWPHICLNGQVWTGFCGLSLGWRIYRKLLRFSKRRVRRHRRLLRQKSRKENIALVNMKDDDGLESDSRSEDDEEEIVVKSDVVDEEDTVFREKEVVEGGDVFTSEVAFEAVSGPVPNEEKVSMTAGLLGPEMPTY